MSGKRYTEDQVTERGYKISEVSDRLGVTPKNLRDWISKYADTGSQHQVISGQQDELRRLKSELRRVLCQRVPQKYAFINSRLNKYRVVVMCRVLGIHRSGFYAWLKCPQSPRALEDTP